MKFAPADILRESGATLTRAAIELPVASSVEFTRLPDLRQRIEDGIVRVSLTMNPLALMDELNFSLNLTIIGVIASLMTARNRKIRSKDLPLRTLHKDGDINLTDFLKKAKKQLSHYFDNEGKTLEDISEETKIPLEELMYRVKINGRYNVWVNKKMTILMDIEKWANKAKKDQIEEEIRERLKAQFGGDKQATRIGQIDLLTKKEIIEIKVIDKWKEGVGQLILFGKIYPNHSKRLHLFGNFPTRIKPDLSTELLTLKLIKEFCNDFNITVSLEGASQFCTLAILKGSEPLVIWLLLGIILQNSDAPILEKELGMNVSERNGIEDNDCMQLSLF